MSTSVDFYATRTWGGLVDKANPNSPLYAPIGGFASRPLDYKQIFAGQKPVQNVVDDVPNGDPVTESVSKISSQASKKITDAKKKGG